MSALSVDLALIVLQSIRSRKLCISGMSNVPVCVFMTFKMECAFVCISSWETSMVQSLVLDTRISFFAAFTVYAVRSIWSFLKILRIGKKRSSCRFWLASPQYSRPSASNFRSAYSSLHSPRLPLSSITFAFGCDYVLDNLRSSGLYCWNGNGVAELLICRRVGNADYKIVGKSLQPRPFARCHASDSIAVYFAFDFCYRSTMAFAT